VDKETVIIKLNHSLLNIDYQELWRYRELFFIFAWRDIKVRYKQTILGVLWVLFQPLVSTFIFTIFFGRLAKISSGELPYSLFVLCGLVFWGFFSNTLTHASSSLIENEGIIKKVYFPRLIIPLSAVVTSFIDFLISFSMLLIFMIYLGKTPSLLFAPVLIIGVFTAAIGASGLGLLLSSFNVKYRDVRYILPFFIQTMLFLTPVIYPTALVRPSNRLIMALNPMTGVIEAVHIRAGGERHGYQTFAMG